MGIMGGLRAGASVVLSLPARDVPVVLAYDQAPSARFNTRALDSAFSPVQVVWKGLWPCSRRDPG